MDEAPLADGETVEKIDKKDLKPLWEDHPHLYKLDPTDDTDTYYAEVCVVDGCGVGRLVRKR